MDSTKGHRISVKFKSANPLFEQWLREWDEQAKLKGSKSHHTLQKALHHLKKCPIPLSSGKECLILKGFGEKLCRMLDEKLEDHKKLKDNKEINPNNLTSGNPNISQDSASRKVQIEEKENEVNSSGDDSSYEYIPMPQTGEYTILLALYRRHIHTNYKGYATKQEIISEAEKFSDSSVTKSVESKKCSVWVGKKTLISKNLLIEKSKPLKYSLTNSGLIVAKKLYDEMHSKIDNNNKNLRTYPSSDKPSHNDPSNDDIINLDNLLVKNRNDGPTPLTSTQSFLESDQIPRKKLPSEKTITKHSSTSSDVATSIQSQPQEEFVIFQPGTFDIILYVDTAETAGQNGKSKSDALLAEIGNLLPSCSYEVKHLSIGDYIWICRQKSTSKELVLPYVVERKRVDDFAGSIKDGRYHEQKFRLKRSGLPHRVYLLEGLSGGRPAGGLPVAALMQAATNTAVQDGFDVRVTSGLRHTAEYLSGFTNLLASYFKDKTLMSTSMDNLNDIDLTDDLIPLMTFKEFNQSSMKNKPMEVTDLFVKMLLQLKGISVEKALAIVEIYPTPELLRKAYIENSSVEGEKLLASIKFGRYKKAIGLTLSKTIYQLFSLESF